jgi:hypothetical protein
VELMETLVIATTVLFVANILAVVLSNEEH